MCERAARTLTFRYGAGGGKRKSESDESALGDGGARMASGARRAATDEMEVGGEIGGCGERDEGGEKERVAERQR